MAATYAEIILPLPVERTFTYSVPETMAASLGIGHRVIVPFGRKKFVTGIVRSLSCRAPEGFEVKEVAVALDTYPIVRHPQLKLWEWIADYYMCSVGDVMKAAIPSGLKVESETFVELNPDFENDGALSLSEHETVIMQLVAHEGHMTVDQIEKRLDLRRVSYHVSNLIEKGVLIISEKIVERYRSRKETYVVPAFTPSAIKEAFESVKGAPKQETLLMALVEMSGINRQSEPMREVMRNALLDRAKVTPAILTAIVRKGLASVRVKEINRFKFDGAGSGTLPQLSHAQTSARDAVVDGWADHSTVLLHGVTSSGKTEIYAHLIDAVLKRGDQVLYLVPEIALTTQLTRRLQLIFGNSVVVYHSKFSDNERVDIWRTLLRSDKPVVILGARSSVFLPFARLGLVIVDEEHDTSYKQSDPAPRYNGRDAALVLASMHGAKSLLGSATPSVETYYKALAGKFGLVTLSERYSSLPLPPVKLIDMSVARRRGEVSGALALDTVRSVNVAVKAHKQAIMFRNRRGYAPIARCRQCAWVPKCQHCDVSLTYHNYSHQLVCHYCGASYPLPELCPQCGLPAVEVVGYGTERLEDEIEGMFPDAKVIRMDLDTTRNRDGYEKLIEQFSDHKADILVGTQMVTKGLDFKDVATVAVLNADELINVPDFKSAERAFNMLEQVAGRAGRSSASRHDDASADVSAEVLVQTYNPSHPIFPFVLAHDYRGFYDFEAKERRQFGYPPFTRIVYLYLKHRDSNELQRLAYSYANLLMNRLGNRVSGPDQPKVSRVKSLYIQKIMIKIEAGASMAKLRDVLRCSYRDMASDPALRSATIYYDVDP